MNRDETEEMGGEIDEGHYELLEKARQLQSGASWFYWIAALSAVNTLMTALGSEWGFALGLAFSQVIDFFGVAFSEEMGSVAIVIAVAINLVIYALMIGIGVMAKRGNKAIYLVGIVFYGLDGLLILITLSPIGIIIHLIALFYMIQGFRALSFLKSLEASESVAAPPSDHGERGSFHERE